MNLTGAQGMEGANASGRTPGLTHHRWQILYAQMAEGHEPCFRTERRHGCPEADCPYRPECMALRAEWRR
jgi:hypothetical protein